MQVALVVGEGLTNAEAAARLFRTAKTIEFHLSNIYRKLGIRSRTELVRKVHDGLPDQIVPVSAAYAATTPTPHA